MIEYLEWLGDCQGQDYTAKVKFTNLRQNNAIAEGKAALEDPPMFKIVFNRLEDAI